MHVNMTVSISVVLRYKSTSSLVILHHNTDNVALLIREGQVTIEVNRMQKNDLNTLLIISINETKVLSARLCYHFSTVKNN